MDRTALIAALGAVTDNDALQLGDKDDTRYFDWSIREGDGVRFEIGDDTESVALELTRAEMVELHKRLTLWLLAN